MTRENPEGETTLAVPVTGTLDLNDADLDWQDSGTPGFWLKPLMESPEHGLRTWLMKVDAGAYSPMHSHDDVEQIYVLDGTFYDQHRTYEAGAMIVRAPHAPHEAGSMTGARMIVSYAPSR